MELHIKLDCQTPSCLLVLHFQAEHSTDAPTAQDDRNRVCRGMNQVWDPTGPIGNKKGHMSRHYVLLCEGLDIKRRHVYWSFIHTYKQ